ncbi:DUF7222 domain-containing protein [Helicobacter cappadocius]|uniref:DUF7222 domain-containing protein n=1 Tax=Helicobacter cappadocius TaxID=3063998 RepID=A0AA90PUH3_9HELI|nr:MULTISPECIES: hypothetical protein [unclassified Helicobacter]MDO7253929.1 hypothetical protein [Helicobacter sp. faydin-H75]MDP2539774.1 hypothetical protein [Helicobacter sp. faydin-H76]
MANKTLVEIGTGGIEELSDKQVVDIYNALKKKDTYGIIDKFKEQMEQLGNSPDELKEFLKNMVDACNYGSNVGISGFIYTDDIKKFFSKNEKELIPLLRDNEDLLEGHSNLNGSKLLDLMINGDQKLSNFALDVYAYHICNLEHGVNLSKDLSKTPAKQKYSPKQEESTPIKSKTRGR